jgi:hypothetical protein
VLPDRNEIKDIHLLLSVYKCINIASIPCIIVSFVTLISFFVGKKD